MLNHGSVDHDLEVSFALLLEMQTVQHNGYDQDPYAKEFGIRISEKLASVEARVLPAPWVRCCLSNLAFVLKMFKVSMLTRVGYYVQLKYHETGKEKDCLPQVGQWNMMNKVSLFVVFTILLYSAVSYDIKESQNANYGPFFYLNRK